MVQEILVNSDPKRFFVPPYMGKQGWVGVRIDYKVKWDQTAAILKDGYLLSALKKVRVAKRLRHDEKKPVFSSDARKSGGLRRRMSRKRRSYRFRDAASKRIRTPRATTAAKDRSPFRLGQFIVGT